MIIIINNHTQFILGHVWCLFKFVDHPGLLYIILKHHHTLRNDKQLRDFSLESTSFRKTVTVVFFRDKSLGSSVQQVERCMWAALLYFLFCMCECETRRRKTRDRSLPELTILSFTGFWGICLVLLILSQELTSKVENKQTKKFLDNLHQT